MQRTTIAAYFCWDDQPLVVGVLRSVGVGALATTLLLLLSGLLFALIGSANMGTLAGAKIFDRGWIATSVAAIIWAPIWETLIAQLIPVSLLMRLRIRLQLAVLVSATVFAAGHVAYGGGIGQGIVTFSAGLLFATLFAANARLGLGRASLFTSTAHVTNNALLILVSFGLSI
jgi:hypothetical protein